MQVTVKLVVFWHPDQNQYCSYCPELKFFFGRGATIHTCIDKVRANLLWELRGRLKYRNLKIRNWQVSENSIIPPTFTNEQAVKRTEQSYEMTITDYQIVEITVDAPKPTDD